MSKLASNARNKRNQAPALNEASLEEMLNQIADISACHRVDYSNAQLIIQNWTNEITGETISEYCARTDTPLTIRFKKK